MDEMNARTASVVGIPSKTAWATTLLLKNGDWEIFGCLSCAGSEKTPHAGRRLIKLLEERRPAEPAALYNLLSSVASNFAPTDVVSWSILTIGPNQQLVLFASGGGVVAVERAGEMRWLANGGLESVVLEGEVKPNDVWLVGTARAASLRSALPTPLRDPDSLVTALMAPTQQDPNSGEMAWLAARWTTDLEAAAGTNRLLVKNLLVRPSPLAAPISPAAAPSSPAVTYLLDPERVQREIANAASDDETRSGQKNNRRRWQLIVPAAFRARALPALIILFLFVGGASTVGWWWRQQLLTKKEYQEVIAPLVDLLSQVRARPVAEKNAARQEMQNLLEREKNTKINYGANRSALAKLQEQTSQLLTDLSGQKSVVNLPVFYDFRLVAANFLAHTASRIQDVAVFLDSAGDRLISLNLTDKTSQALSANGLTKALDIAGLSKDAVVVDGVVVKRVPLSGASPAQLTTINSIKEASLIDTFGDVLYIFDQPSQQLWKLPTTQGATASGWIRSARGVRFDTITSLAINGSVWMGASDGVIYQFTRGERVNFAPQGLLEPFTTTVLLTVNPEGEKLVAVEPAKQRLVVMDKNGAYQQQINSPQLGAVTDIFLSADEKSAYLVAGSVVYKVEI